MKQSRGGSASAKARQLCGSTLGTYVGEHSCSYYLHDGILYVGMNSACFLSTGIETDRRIDIHFGDVAGLSKIEDDGLCITDLTGEEFVFRSFKTRDAVLKRLIELKDQTFKSAPVLDEDDVEVIPERPTLRRSASLPSVRVQPQVDAAPEDQFELALRDLSNLSFAVRQQVDIEKIQEGSGETRRGAAPPASELRAKSMRFFSQVEKKRTPQDLKNAWKKLKSQADPNYKDVAFQNLKLPCDVDTFYKNFWSNTAKYPISSFQSDVIKDKNITTSEWDDSGDGFTMKRTIQFLHPNKSPVGPKEARSEKEQTLQKYSTQGMVLCTVTRVHDVPNADCFVLDDQILVDAAADGSGGVVVSAKLGIRFVKHTMWKKIIEKNSIAGLTDWLKKYADFLKSKARG